MTTGHLLLVGGLILTGIWGSLLLKHWLDERVIRRQLQEEILYLWGGLQAIKPLGDDNVVDSLHSFDRSVRSHRRGTSYLKGMIGYLEREAQEAETKWIRYQQLTDEKNEMATGYLLLRDQAIRAGLTPPEPPEGIKVLIERIEGRR